MTNKQKQKRLTLERENMEIRTKIYLKKLIRLESI